MVKYFCDLCGNERKKGELEVLAIGELAEVANFEICPSCRNRIVQAAKTQSWGEDVCGVPDPDPKEEPAKKTRVDLGKVMALYNAGWSQNKIADEMHFSQATVNRAIKKLREEGLIR